MTKSEFIQKYGDAVNKIDNKITAEYFEEKMKLYTEEGTNKMSLEMAAFAAIRESVCLNTEFLQDVLENVLEFDD